MAGTDPQAVVTELLARHGRTFAEEIDADVPADTAEGMFRLAVFALLASARIRTSAAVEATRALMAAGWTTAAAMADASWEDRTRVLNRSGYARYDERTSRNLADACRHLLSAYDGDVRRLREAADREPTRERTLIQELKGIGPAGADIFLREAQAGWDELVPYLDGRARDTARALGLPADPHRLLDMVGRTDFPRLVAALVRSRIDHDVDEVRGAASQRR
jgi:endonuclease III